VTTNPPRPRRRTERGAMAIELVLLTPVLIGAIMVIAGGARYVDARGQTSSAAFAAARAASLTTNQADAVAAGQGAAKHAYAEHGHACATLSVDINAQDFRPGGAITATVTCVTDLTDIAGFGLPGQKTFSATATVPVEEHRDGP